MLALLFQGFGEMFPQTVAQEGFVCVAVCACLCYAYGLVWKAVRR